MILNSKEIAKIEKNLTMVKNCNERNIRDLYLAVIEQACNDYEYIIKNGHNGEKKLHTTKEWLEWFFSNNCDSYGKALGVSGNKMLKQMRENFKKYGQVRIPMSERK